MINKMEKYREIKYLKIVYRILKISIGFAVSGFGTAMMYHANIGSTPNATMADGLHAALHISYGMGNVLMNLLMLVPVLIFARELIGIGTWLCIFTMGIYINFWGGALPELPAESGMTVRILCACLGNIIFAAGLSFYVRLGEGLGPLDAITELLRRRLKCSYGMAKCIGDGTFLIIGIALGGVAGIATVISVFCTGYFMQCFFLFYDKKISNRKRLKQKTKRKGERE